MPTSPTDPGPRHPARLRRRGDGAGALAADRGRPRRRARRGGRRGRCSPPGTRTALAVPGAEVTIHWLDLAEGLTPAQAAAAARLMLADASADPLADMHVAVGLPERDLTPVALVPVPRDGGLDRARSRHNRPDLAAAAAARGRAGPARRGGGARLSRRRRRVQRRARARRTCWSARRRPRRSTRRRSRPASPPLCRRRSSTCARAPSPAAGSGGSTARACAASPGWSLALAALVADRPARPDHALIPPPPAGSRTRRRRSAARAPARGDSRPGFTPLAAILFEAIRAVPNVELSRIDYRPDGTLAAIVTVDSPATLAALRRQIETSGLHRPGRRGAARRRRPRDRRIAAEAGMNALGGRERSRREQRLLARHARRSP